MGGIFFESARPSYSRRSTLAARFVEPEAFQAPLMGQIDPQHVIGVHVKALVTFPSGDPTELADLTPSELRMAGFKADVSSLINQ